VGSSQPMLNGNSWLADGAADCRDEEEDEAIDEALGRPLVLTSSSNRSCEKTTTTTTTTKEQAGRCILPKGTWGRGGAAYWNMNMTCAVSLRRMLYAPTIDTELSS
jgi:hypothetical protein